MKRTSFTLIELLVVIGVIAMLISILAPGLYAAKEQARTAVCSSNLRQLALALTVYEQENETFPAGFNDLTCAMARPPGGYLGNAVNDKMGWWWLQFSADSWEGDFTEGSVIWCPARRISGPLTKANVLCGNYGVNRAICKDAQGIIGSEFTGRALGLSQIWSPAKTLLIADSGYALISWCGATNGSVVPFENPRRVGTFYVPGLSINTARTFCPGHEQDAIEGRHPNKTVNVGFADGHISCVKADDLFVEKTGDGYSNRSPLWLPN